LNPAAGPEARDQTRVPAWRMNLRRLAHGSLREDLDRGGKAFAIQEDSKLQSVGHLEAPEQPREVRLHGALGDLQMPRDLPVGRPFRDERGNLVFPARQAPKPVRWPQ
jgi:hypothetical protein